jgi:hypothetical protein
MTSTNLGASWTQETQLTVDNSANVGVSAFQASNGTIWVVWASDRTGNYDLYYKTSSNLGASWSNDTQLTFHPAIDLKPVIHQMSDKSIWIVWSSNRNGSYDLYQKTSSDNGASWSDETRLTTDSSLNKMPSLTQTSDGSTWIVWASSRSGSYDLYYKASADFGASWSKDTQLTNGPKIDSNPQILQTIDGKIWIFWSSRKASTTADDDIYYMHSTDNGVTWSDSIQFTNNEYDDVWPSLVQTHLVKIWVVWTSNRADQPDGNWEIYCKSSLAGDVNEDNKVDVIDLTMASLSYGSFAGEPRYKSNVDIDKDGLVDMSDLVVIAYSLGET